MLGSTNKVANTPMHILFKCIHKLQRHRSQSYKVQELNLRVEMKRVQGPDHLSVNVRKSFRPSRCISFYVASLDFLTRIVTENKQQEA